MDAHYVLTASMYHVLMVCDMHLLPNVLYVTREIALQTVWHFIW